MDKKILEVCNLRKIYHTKNEETLAVDNFSFTLNEGEIIAIVGPSGCGKSTILNIIGGLIDSSSGTIKKDNNIKLGYMLQDDALFPFRNILDNCKLGLEIQKEITNDNISYINNLLKKYGLEDFKKSYPENLSGGMRQRCALIRTLATKPSIILLDEAFSALDFQTRLVLVDDVYNIIKEENKSCIMITHNIEEAVSMADKVIVLSDRPSVIKSIYNIEFDNKNIPSKNRKNLKFMDYCELIWKDIELNV